MKANMKSKTKKRIKATQQFSIKAKLLAKTEKSHINTFTSYLIILYEFNLYRNTRIRVYIKNNFCEAYIIIY